MPFTHVVRQGECLASISERYGYPDFRRIYQHALNADLRKLRPDPHALYAGDRVVIPDKDESWSDCATGARHDFKLARPPVGFRMHFNGSDGTPFADTPYEVTFGDAVYSGKTDGTGKIEHLIASDAEVGTLKLWLYGPPPDTAPLVFEVRLGHLDPVETTSGVLGRLRNLGFHIGELDDADGDDARNALAAFQAKHGLEATGEIDDATRAKLKSKAETT